MYVAQASIQVTPDQIQVVDEGIPQGAKIYYGIGAITTGSVFNTRIKTLVSGNKITDTSASDSLVKHFIFRSVKTETENEEFFNDTEKWIGIGSYQNYAGAYASWDEETQTVTIATGEKFCLLNKDSSHMFQRFTELEEISSEALNSQVVTNLNSAFENCYTIEYFDFSQWKTPKLSDMGNCFNGCRALKEMDLSIFDTTSLSNIRGLLSGALALTSVVFFNDIRNSVYAQEAFMNCRSLENFEATHYAEFVDSSSVQGIGQMFAECQSLRNLDLTSWNTSRLTSYIGVFSGCKNLESLDISTWTMNSGVSTLNSLFKGCENLYDLKFWSESPYDGRGWYDYISPLNISEMFRNCTRLGTVQEVRDGEIVYTPGTFIFPKIHLKNTAQVITNASQRATAQNVLVGCYGIKTLDISNLQIETTLPLNNDNLLESGQLDEISNWTPLMWGLSYSFEYNEETGSEKLILTTGNGHEKLYVQLAVQKNTEYSWVFNFNAPEGFNGTLRYYVTGYDNNNWQDQYNVQNRVVDQRIIAQGIVSNKISSQPIEYTVNFNSGNYTQIRLFYYFWHKLYKFLCCIKQHPTV